MDLLGAIVSTPSVNGGKSSEAAANAAPPTLVLPGFGQALAHALRQVGGAGARGQTTSFTTEIAEHMEMLMTVPNGNDGMARAQSQAVETDALQAAAPQAETSLPDIVLTTPGQRMAPDSMRRIDGERTTSDSMARIGNDGTAPVNPDGARSDAPSADVTVDLDLHHVGATATESTDASAVQRSAEPRVSNAAPTRDVAKGSDALPIERSADRLVGEFRTRLEHVIGRMREEFGYEVRVVETWRSQERQELLYAQGRTAPGRTVTWTQNSNHTAGRAADVMIDGDYTDATAFARLGRIAKEEGLRTLAGDPGHIEMPGEGVRTDSPVRGTPAGVVPADRPRMAAVTNAGSMVAQVAAVARPAAVAQVARTAQVAHTAPLRNTAPAIDVDASPVEPRHEVTHSAAPRLARAEVEAPRVETQTVAKPAARPVQAEPLASNATVAAAVPSPVAARRPVTGDASRRLPSEEGNATERGRTIDTVIPPLSPANPAGTVARAGATLPTESTNIAERVARVFALRDAMESAPTTGITLTIDDAQGTAARIRLGMRAAAVNATLDVADPVVAHELHAHISELQRALESHGLEARTLAVRSVAQTSDASEITRPLSAALVQDTGASNRAGSETLNDRSSGSPRREFASPDHRNKRQNKENSP